MRINDQPLLNFLKKAIKRTIPEPLVLRYISKLPSRLAEELSGFSDFPDRQFLKFTIFSHLIQKPDYQRILFVGCDWYTGTYERITKGKDYWTIEPDPKKKKFGAKKHIVAPLRDLDKYFPPEYFDAIICNGVFYKGAIDTWDEAEYSFDQCFTRLRSGGVFVLGWNDTPELRPYPPEESQALKQFKPYSFPPISVAKYLTDTWNRHTYSFFIKN